LSDSTGEKKESAAPAGECKKNSEKIEPETALCFLLSADQRKTRPELLRWILQTQSQV
jgi:hypothetical protein